MGCSKLNERIDNVSSRVDDIENTQINSLKQQIAAMGESVTKLEKTDTELKAYIETLQSTATDLRKSISENDTKIAELEKSLDQAVKDAQNSDSALKSDLEQQIATAKTDVLSQLASAKTAMESRLDQIESTIATLQQKDTELEKKIADLKTYIDSGIADATASTKEWASATFATLEQYNSIVSDISGIRGSIESLESSIEALESDLSGTIKKEVVDALAPIKNPVMTEAALAIVDGYIAAISSASGEIADLVSKVKVIEDGVRLIKEDVDNIKKEIEEINSRLDSDKTGVEVQSIVFVPEYSDGNIRVIYNSEDDGSFTPEKITICFAITPAEIAGKLTESWNSSLSLEATYTRTKAAAAGDDISIPILEVSATNGKLTLTASAETIDEAFFRKELAASVRLVINLDGISKSSEYVPMIPAVDSGAETGENINIPDIYFKAYLVDNFDVNGDGEISVDEALAVKEINIASSSLPIRSLSGIEYFNKLETLDCSGNNIAVLDLSSNAVLRRLNCSNNSLTEIDLSEKLYLTDVDCSENKINKLILSNACGLRNLNCSRNAIEEINLHDSQFLSKLECYSNPVKELILDNCEELSELYASDISISELNLTAIRQLKILDISNNVSLTRVICPSSQWLYGVFASNDLSLSYVDTTEHILYWGSSIVIDGVVWAGYNVGSHSEDFYGNTYTFDATNVCPEGWKAPTKSELQSLSKNYSSEVIVNGMPGRWFSGSKKYSELVPAVFLPYKSLSSRGCYWSSTVSSGGYGYYLYFGGSSVDMYTNSLSYTCAVRCVKN